MRVTSSVRVALIAGVAASAAMLSMATAAQAAKSGTASAGHSTLALSGKVIKTLQTFGGCGTLTATPVGAASVTVSAKGGIKIKLPITGVVTTDTGAIRLAHAGSGVELQNSCYDITMSSFYVQDLGDGTSESTFDVLARNKSADDSGVPRDINFTIDLTNANVTVTGATTKVRSANLLLADEGAQELNELATGSDSGPFMTGDQVGMAQSFYRIPAPAPVAP